jgi:hypothetical protein
LLQPVILGATTTFGRYPGDDAVWVSYVTRFAMDAVGGVDFQSASVSFIFHLIDLSRAEELAGIAVF